MPDQSDIQSDDRLRDDAVARLRANPILDAGRVALTASTGEVTLHGTVYSDYTKRLAEALIKEIPGLRRVRNELSVQQSPHTSISGTVSGIAEGGATSDLGRTSPQNPDDPTGNAG